MAEKEKGIVEDVLERVGVKEVPFFKTPDYMYNPSYWLGAMVAGAFVYTVITGLLLLLYYQPSYAYQSTMNIIYHVPYGPVLLFSHLYGAYIMIILAYIHMFRNFYAGAYKKPRELQWVTGVLLLLLTLGASFFGYSLVSDVLGVNAVDIGSELMVGTGFPGATVIVNWLFGPGALASISSSPLTRAELFDRLLGWHIILVFLIGALFGFHFMLSERYGMTPSKKEKPKVPAYYTKEEWSKFNEWWPRNVVYMMSIVLTTWGIILFVPNLLANINGLPIVINPYPAPQAGTPQAAGVQPYPPWFFLFLYKFVDFELPNGQPLTPAMVIAVLVFLLLIVMLLPFYENSQWMYLRNRKFWVWVMTLAWIYLVELSLWGYYQPGVPAPFTEQVELLGPPAVIVGLIILFWGRGKENRDKGVSLNFMKTVKMTPYTVLIGSVAGLAFAGSLVNFFEEPAIVNLIALFPLGIFTFIWTYKLGRAIIRGEGTATSMAGGYKRKDIAFVGIVAILVIVAILAGVMWTLPSVGPQATYAGMDLGVILILFGGALQLYHYIIYVK
ncbi:proton pump complex cytochrome B SoxC [Stygiolobus caldivivus]|uniref:Cytochrome b n=1 Tax=Stygiolobus caldivivus TaxID=2824673 RepID=A0A8D5U795_9CREN|nr:proton pump complex cytochrome B SoxC [Stygiolobus caldivivus]BCU71005.1 cytochrome b [Stygiolobus caldivivus]